MRIATDNFNTAYDFTFDIEGGNLENGGYHNDPADPGGETKYGISKQAYPSVDIKNLTVGDAKMIYFMDYWRRSGAEHQPLDVAIALFDAAVNLGNSRARRIAIEADYDVEKMIKARADYYNQLVRSVPSLRKFYNGWMNRVIKLRRYIDKVVGDPMTDVTA